MVSVCFVSQNTPNDSVVYVRMGSMVLFKGGEEVPDRTIKEGTFFGEESLCTVPVNWEFTVVAKEQCEGRVGF